MSSLNGSCHCGQVKFTVEIASEQTMECNCSICSKKGAIYLTAKSVKIIEGEDKLNVYQFGTHTAKHHFCRQCGIQPFTNPRINPRVWLVNARCLDNFNYQSQSPMLFDGQNWEAAAQAFLKNIQRQTEGV